MGICIVQPGVVLVAIILLPQCVVCVVVATRQQVTFVGDNTTVDCPLVQAHLPIWVGPPDGVVYALTGSTRINPDLDNTDRVSYAANNRDLIITGVQLSDGGDFTCVITEDGVVKDGVHTLLVRIRPQPPEISNTVTIEGVVSVQGTAGHPLTLECISRGGNPAPTVAWYSQADTLTPLTSKDTGPDVAGVFTVTVTYSFTPTRDKDGVNYICRSSFPDPNPEPVDTSVQLFLNYKPITTIPDGDQTVTEGTQMTILTCKASSKPPATFTWYTQTGNIELGSSTGSQADNQWTYIIPNVDRSQSGSYRCTADNGVGSSDDEIMQLTVKYPPDVTATGKVTGQTLDIMCSPSGVPAVYNYSSWVHKWSNGQVISQLRGGSTLTLTGLTYQDSGKYTCRVSNGVAPYGTNDDVREGSTSVITIDSLPIITSPVMADNEVVNIPIRLRHPSSINITYYSSVDGNNVICDRVNGAVTQTRPVCVVTTSTYIIQLNVFGSTVTTQGSKATVIFTITNESELGSYQVHIHNAMGTKTIHMAAVPERPPDKPVDPKVTDVLTTSVNVSWILGYHGGPGQIFVVQYSTDGVTWIDGAMLDTGLSTSRDRYYVTLDSLRHGQLYSLRIHAYNRVGQSPNTGIFNVTTISPATDTESQTSGDIIPAVGGTVAVLVVIGVVVGVVLLYKKGYRFNMPCHRSGKYSDQVYENDIGAGVAKAQQEMLPVRAAIGTHGTDGGQDAALSYEMLTATRTEPGSTYDVLNTIGDGQTGADKRGGSVAGAYEFMDSIRAEKAPTHD